MKEKNMSEKSVMGFANQTGINPACSVMISGVTNSSADEEIIDHLRRYGALKNILTITDTASNHYKNLIAEFEEIFLFFYH